jgi:hypothetical protein
VKADNRPANRPLELDDIRGATHPARVLPIPESQEQLALLHGPDSALVISVPALLVIARHFNGGGSLQYPLGALPGRGIEIFAEPLPRHGQQHP